MIFEDIYELAVRRWGTAPAWLRVGIFAGTMAALTIWPPALLEILESPGDKLWVASISFVATLGLLAGVFSYVDSTLRPVRLPRESRKQEVHVFLPANTGHARGDFFLQYAGFTAAAQAHGENLDIKFYDSSLPGWTEQLERCITGSNSDEPVWLVITMSQQGREARAKLTELLSLDERLDRRLTALFTVSSSRFETSDRNTMFRLFVSGDTESLAIASGVRLLIPPTPITQAKPRVLCCHIDSPYGLDTSDALSVRLGPDYAFESVITADLSQKNLNEYVAVIVVAYDVELRETFDELHRQGFKGSVFGTTTMSVPDWQKLIRRNQTDMQIFHTAVSGMESDLAFREGLAPITIDSLVGPESLMSSKTALALGRDAQVYDAYRSIEENYISALCWDCIRILDLAARTGHATLRSLLDDPDYDAARSDLTIVRDTDFGVTGDAQVGVYLKRMDDQPLSLPASTTRALGDTAGGPQEKRALIVVDYQNDFLESGALPVEGASTLAAGLTSAVALAVASDWAVFFTRDWHPEDHSSFLEYGGEWPRHCVRDTEGAEISLDPEILALGEVVSKGVQRDGDGYSPFESPELDELLRDAGVGSLVVVGLALDYCVKETCLNGVGLGYDVTVVTSLVRPVDSAKTEDLLEELSNSGVTPVSDLGSLEVP